MFALYMFGGEIERLFGARRFVTFTYLVIGGVIAYALISGPDGFAASVNKFLTATPAPSASPSASPSTSATP